MAYKIKKSRGKGRPKAIYKVRTIKGFTPKGFELDEIDEKNKVIKFKKKEKNEK